MKTSSLLHLPQELLGGWQRAEMIRVCANGIEFEVATMGSGERLALCLHGFPEHAFSWRFQMPLLVRLGYRVWAPNLRGYGNSDAPRGIEAYRVDVLVEDVAELIRAAGASETVLIGHDWGGVLAWELATRHAELISRLVVMNMPHPACFLRELKQPAQRRKSWYILFFQLPILPELMIGRSHCRPIGEMIVRSAARRAQFPEDVLRVYRENAARPGRLTAMLNWYRGIGRDARKHFKRQFPPIKTKTLLIWGDADAFLGNSTLPGTEEYVEHLTLRTLPGVSHWVQQEAPDEVNAVLESWLSGGS